MNLLCKTGSVIEVGTNSVKFLAGRIEKGNLQTLDYRRIITRLGQGLDKSGVILPEAVDRTLEAVGGFLKLAEEYQSEKTFVFGTYALRRASNASLFLHKCRNDLNIAVEVLSGKQEADLGREGVLLDIGKRMGLNPVIIDIGGGSTEISDNSRGISIPVGAVSLTESFLQDDPPSEDSMAEVSLRVHDILINSLKDIRQGPEVDIAGVGGTITTVAALIQGLKAFDPEKIHGYEIEQHRFDEVFRRLILMNPEERKNFLIFDPGRADIIIGGMIILREIFNLFNIKGFYVSINNVIHGMFHNRFAEFF